MSKCVNRCHVSLLSQCEYRGRSFTFPTNILPIFSFLSLSSSYTSHTSLSLSFSTVFFFFLSIFSFLYPSLQSSFFFQLKSFSYYSVLVHFHQPTPPPFLLWFPSCCLFCSVYFFPSLSSFSLSSHSWNSSSFIW